MARTGSRRGLALLALAATGGGLAVTSPAVALPTALSAAPSTPAAPLAARTARAARLDCPPSQQVLPVAQLEKPARHGGSKIKDGAFVRYANRLFVVVGGAPLYVSDPALVPGADHAHPAALTRAAFATLRQYPRNGTFVTERTQSHVYEFVDGFPLAVTSWTAVGGRKPVRIIDVNDVHGGAFPWDGVAPVPVDLDHGPFGPTFVRDVAGRKTYKLVGGAPQLVHDWKAYGGAKPALAVDPYVIRHAGTGTTERPVLNSCPESGWTVQVTGTRQVYTVVGGAPVYAPAAADQAVRPTLVEPADFPSTGDRPAMAFRPADQSLLRSRQTGLWWAVVGGRVLDPSPPTRGNPPPVTIDQAAVDRAGEAGVWNHLLPAAP